MKLSLEGLQILDAISRRGSFAAAAEELYRVPSTITYAVQKLEEDLGVALFQRNGHRPRLTPAGEALLEEGRVLLQAASELEARVRHVSEGFEARLGLALEPTLPRASLLELAREFYADPQHAQTDCASRTIPAAPPRRSPRTRPTSSSAWFVLAASPAHALALQRGPIPAHALRKHRIALVADAERFVAGQPSMGLPTLHAKIAAMKSGAAAGFVARLVVARELAAGELVEVALERPLPRQDVHLVWDERPKGKAFLWWLERLEGPTLVEEWLRRSGAPSRQPPVALVRQA